MYIYVSFVDFHIASFTFFFYVFRVACTIKNQYRSENIYINLRCSIRFSAYGLVNFSWFLVLLPIFFFGLFHGLLVENNHIQTVRMQLISKKEGYDWLLTSHRRKRTKENQKQVLDIEIKEWNKQYHWQPASAYIIHYIRVCIRYNSHLSHLYPVIVDSNRCRCIFSCSLLGSCQ